MTEPAILVVEDDELVRLFLCRALAGVSSEVEACATGAEAISALATQRFDVVLLDGLLPDTHGIDLAQRVLAHHNGARSGILFVSGTIRHPVAMRHGISALPKPLRLTELIDAVRILVAWRAGAPAAVADRIGALDDLATSLLVS